MWAQSHLIKSREPEREARVEYFIHETAQAQRGSASAPAHITRKGPCHHHSTFYPFLACFCSIWWCLKLVKSQTKVKNLDFQEMTSPGKKPNKSGLLPLRCGHLIGAHGAAGPDRTQKAPSPSSRAISTRCPVPHPYLEELQLNTDGDGGAPESWVKMKEEDRAVLNDTVENPVLCSCSLRIDPASLSLTFTPLTHLFLEPQDRSGVEGSQGLALASNWVSYIPH